MEQGLAWPYLNADDIGREELPRLSGAERDVAAGRLLLTRMDFLAQAHAEFAFETTLSSRLYARRIPTWRKGGALVELMYIRLPDVQASIMRVARRVGRGGHGIPEATLRRRFDWSLANLEIYKSLVDQWRVWESREDRVILQERSKA